MAIDQDSNAHTTPSTASELSSQPYSSPAVSAGSESQVTQATHVFAASHTTKVTGSNAVEVSFQIEASAGGGYSDNGYPTSNAILIYIPWTDIIPEIVRHNNLVLSLIVYIKSVDPKWRAAALKYLVAEPAKIQPSPHPIPASQPLPPPPQPITIGKSDAVRFYFRLDTSMATPDSLLHAYNTSGESQIFDNFVDWGWILHQLSPRRAICDKIIELVKSDKAMRRKVIKELSK